MRFAPTEQAADFRSAVKGLLADTCDVAALRSSWGGEVGRHTEVGDGNGRVPAAWSALAEMGVLGLLVPESAGGLGMTQDDLVGIVLECGYAGLPDPIVDTAALAPVVLAASGSDSAADLLAGIASGEISVAVGFGEHPNVPSASTVDYFVLVGESGAYLAKPDQVGVEPLESVDGSRDLARLTWDARGIELLLGVDSEHVLNEVENAAATFTAAQLVGLSRRMLDMTVEYTSERKQFGVAIGTFQAVKHTLANASLDVEFAEPLALAAAHELSVGADATVASAMAKSRASRAAQGASDACLQMHGAIGYTVEHDLHLFMKRAWALSRHHGSEDHHRAVVRRALLG